MVQLVDLGEEGVGVLDLLEHEGPRLRGVFRFQDGVRDAPQLGELAVEADDAPVGVDDEDAVRRGLERGVQEGQRLAQALLGALPIADVPGDHHHLPVVHRRDGGREPHLAALDLQAVLGLHGLARRQGAADVPEELVGIVLVKDLVQSAADQLGGGPVEQRGTGRRDLDVAPVHVEHENHVADRREQRLQLGLGFAQRRNGGGRVSGHAGVTILTRPPSAGNRALGGPGVMRITSLWPGEPRSGSANRARAGGSPR